ncbi:hypothetical protein L3X38_002946 [Prunus dulcis]|uniref:Uncharacterized protein n=1 Tax=Prunus dulcis TaxID=3755 RepID=A0AAD4WV12_PRUDU|nr:hypothetical protein L3X38_002946 [Prunus dulcis]
MLICSAPMSLASRRPAMRASSSGPLAEGWSSCGDGGCGCVSSAEGSVNLEMKSATAWSFDQSGRAHLINLPDVSGFCYGVFLKERFKLASGGDDNYCHTSDEHRTYNSS